MEVVDPRFNELTGLVVDTAYHVHVRIGPGLLESVYELVLAKRLEQRGLLVQRQVPIKIDIDGMQFDEGLRADLLVTHALNPKISVIIELKSLESLHPVHSKQVLTYLRLLDLPVGLLLNFGAVTMKEGTKRIINPAASLLRPSNSTPVSELAADEQK